MKNAKIQIIVFVVVIVSLFVGPILNKPGVITYFSLAGAIFYLFLGWLLPMIKDEKNYVAHEIVGFIYASVMIASFLEQMSISGARYFTYYAEVLAIGLLVYMVLKRKEVLPGMIIQSVILCMFVPIPVFVYT